METKQHTPEQPLVKKMGGGGCSKSNSNRKVYKDKKKKLQKAIYLYLK